MDTNRIQPTSIIVEALLQNNHILVFGGAWDTYLDIARELADTVEGTQTCVIDFWSGGRSTVTFTESPDPARPLLTLCSIPSPQKGIWPDILRELHQAADRHGWKAPQWVARCNPLIRRPLSERIEMVARVESDNLTLCYSDPGSRFHAADMTIEADQSVQIDKAS